MSTTLDVLPPSGTSSPQAPSASSRDEADGAAWRQVLARVGLAGKGVIHLTVGFIIARVVAGGIEEEAGPRGAIRWIAELPGGVVLLWVLAGSLASLAIWRATVAIDGDPVQSGAIHRVVFALKAFFFGSLAIVAGRGALEGGRSVEQDKQAEQAASVIADLPGGRWLLIGAGVVILGVALWLVVQHAVIGEFQNRLTDEAGPLVAAAGRVGYGLRSVAYAFVGAFFIQAGMANSDRRAKGLPAALRRVSDYPWGRPVLAAVALGFASYGIYCFFESRYRADA